MSDAFNELAQLLKTAGVELILLEMMYHPERVRPAVEAALATRLPVWFGLSARRANDGRVVSYYRSEDLALEEITGLIPGTGVDAAGPMHTNSEIIADALSITRKHFSGALMSYPDSGTFEMPNWRFDNVLPPERFEAFCQDWIRAGSQVLGGCCGLTPEHIRAAVRARAVQRGRPT
jgi:methionine synthase I (cobalamin-dependent)